MKDARDPGTSDLFTKRGPGRPRKANALSPAQRAKRYRQNRALRGDDQRLLTAIDRALLRRLVRDELNRERALSGAGGLPEESEWMQLLEAVLPKLSD